jgi:hypothetical protein
MGKNGDDLSPEVRAEDILLGSLGFGEDARIRTIERTDSGYMGTGVWSVGSEFSFESEDELDGLQKWALDFVLAQALGKTA